jgi:hypothetical protein
MMFDEGHPIISRKDWMNFQLWMGDLPNWQLLTDFSGSVDRESIDLPYWFLPLSRGALIAGPGLLGPHYISKLALASRGWTRRSADVYERTIGKTRLRVRRTNDGRFWLISRWLPGVPMHSDRRSETIVHLFGSTPIVTANLHEALYLAHRFQTNDPVGGLLWTRVSPHYLVGAIKFANERAQSEGLTISWHDLWASTAHSRRMKTGRARRCANGKLLLPVMVRVALGTAVQR